MHCRGIHFNPIFANIRFAVAAPVPAIYGVVIKEIPAGVELYMYMVLFMEGR